MATAQASTAPRASRGKHQHPQSAAQAQQGNGGKPGQRRPKGKRAHNTNSRSDSASASPSRRPLNPDPTFAESAVCSGEEAQLPTRPHIPKKHTQSQPSVDRVSSPKRTQTSLTDNEAAPNNLSATPAKVQGAYAGPTFHASPAPSALPIPKFLSRSVPAKTQPGPPTPPPEDSSDSASSPSPAASPSRPSIPVPQRTLESPLDLLFKADRAERAKNMNGSPASTNFFNPSSPMRPQHYRQDSYNSLNAPFPIELDGESRNAHMSPPPAASPAALRSVTDPCKVPQLNVSQSPKDTDVVQDLFSRLSMSSTKPTSSTPPGQAPSHPQARHETPSPSHDGHSAVRSASSPSTPSAATQEAPDFFYGNRNLSPLFKAAKADSPKRNSGLRTEITADSPVVAQGMFQDFPSVCSPPTIDPNTFSRGYSGNDGGSAMGPRRGSAPYIQPYREMPNNRRTPRRQAHQPRPDSYPFRVNNNGPGTTSTKAAVNGAHAPVKKPATSMMSFVPASVAAKKHSSSTPPSTATPPPMKTYTSSDTSALEQNLKHLLQLQITGNAPGVR